jgi:predicted Zn-dependent protease
MLLTRDECKTLTDKVIRLGKGGEVEVRISSTQNANTRYANNTVTTAGFTSGVSVDISVTQEKRTGTVSVSELSDEALERAVRQAEAVAALAPPDPEYVEPLGPQTYPEIKGFYDETARARTADIVPAVKAVVAEAEQKKVASFGYYDISSRARALANKRGLFGYHRDTLASYSVTARTPDATGSGWAAQQWPQHKQIDAARIGATAIRKALESRAPQKLDPGLYTVILEPQAVADLLGFLGGGFNARAADEGRSFLSKKGGGSLLGEKVFGENVTLWSDPFDARVPGAPWSGAGIPAAKTSWVEKGVVKNLIYDRYWAQKNERAATPGPSNYLMEGGKATLEELIASTERGLLVTHFWYIRFLQPQTLQLTGLTRDGLFYIEKGKVVRPAMNFRFNQSVVTMLNKIEAMTAAVPVEDSVLPALKVSEFNFSSLSDAV